MIETPLAGVTRQEMKASWRKRIRKMFRRKMPRCAYCHRRLYEPTIDHLQPLAQGGTHDAGNLVASCAPCNTIKGNRSPEQWAADILDAYARTLELMALDK